MAYVDGFVLPIPKKNLKAYASISKRAGKIWRKHGALDYKECVGDDFKKTKWSMAFPQLVKPKAGETVVFAYIVYKSRAHRDSVNAKVMKDPKMQAETSKPMPFDMKRMAYGGFKVFVQA